MPETHRISILASDNASATGSLPLARPIGHAPSQQLLETLGYRPEMLPVAPIEEVDQQAYDAFWKQMREGSYQARQSRRDTETQGKEVHIAATYKARPPAALTETELREIASRIDMLASAAEQLHMSLREIERRAGVLKSFVHEAMFQEQPLVRVHGTMADCVTRMLTTEEAVETIAKQLHRVGLNMAIEAGLMQQTSLHVLADEMKILGGVMRDLEGSTVGQRHDMERFVAETAIQSEKVTQQARDLHYRVADLTQALAEQHSATREISLLLHQHSSLLADRLYALEHAVTGPSSLPPSDNPVALVSASDR